LYLFVRNTFLEEETEVYLVEVLGVISFQVLVVGLVVVLEEVLVYRVVVLVEA
jgi:hypothetical protein